MKPNVSVRDARLTDLQDLMAVRYADHPAIHRDRLRDAAARHVRYLVAEYKGTLVGFGVLALSRPPKWPDSAPTKYLPLVIDLYVAEALRGRGIGTSMMRHMEQLAVDVGFEKLYLSVGPFDNPEAYDLYLGLGYQPLQDEPYLGHWRFTDSDGVLHEGAEWMVDMEKVLS